ncbi:hypothetical protein F2P81_013858 [Scophthalmus maximus]|uniref:Uncharacterized protein n=1 Tax=Scophthalmus maximus TaxID=52904 RepID=A0A6A4SUL4_SCOMX|nr:hypothetical protein F2P81_013858 [Scophthalmus maximus]
MVMAAVQMVCCECLNMLNDAIYYVNVSDCIINLMSGSRRYDCLAAVVKTLQKQDAGEDAAGRISLREDARGVIIFIFQAGDGALWEVNGLTQLVSSRLSRG